VLFEELLVQGLEQAKRHGRRLAVMFIDVDNFKSINDSHGHAVGDKVLLMVANRLLASIRSEDTVSRWGGDEFMALLLEVKQEADMVQLAEKMVEQVAEAWEFNGIVFSLSVSIGITIYPADGETADILFTNSDRAMYKAKGPDQRVMLFRESALN